MRDHVAPVCAPGFAADLSDVDDSQLIHVDWGESYSSYPTWAGWFRHFDIARDPNTSKGLRVGGTGIGIELAAQGAGVMLAPLHLAGSELATGKLMRLGQDRLRLPFGYCATRTAGRVKQPYVTALLHELNQPTRPQTSTS
ncbi:LysR substrate-binding domain-containing protein [Ruegeria sp.]|uniref:LysR substrate-binding domain-containing protein n=1 Tax=Ruegeria sp. TaxID=1879320 RepID=UPI003B599D9C